MAITQPNGAVLSPAQKVRLRELLTQQWQETVARLTELSLRLYEAGDNVDEHLMVVDLSRMRLALQEIEDALGRLDQGVYGRCGGCDVHLPFERLEAAPRSRYCECCQP